MFIKVHDRIALVTKQYNSVVWKLRFVDNGEVVSVFYSLDHEYNFLFFRSQYEKDGYN